MGGLSFNANFREVNKKLIDIPESNIQLRGQIRQRSSVFFKAFLSHNFKNIEFYATAGVKLKNIKYTCIEQIEEGTYNPLTKNSMQSKSKTHFVPVLGIGINIPLKEVWFARCEYTFDFPYKVSLNIKERQTNGVVLGVQKYSHGCKTIKHYTHNIRIGFGRYL